MPALANDKHEAFCSHYMVCFNATEAAKRAGYSAKTAGAIGHDLLKKPEIIERLAELKAAQANRLDIEADDILMLWWKTASADANELTQHRIGCCRYCHGIGHEYQWRTEREYQIARFRFEENRKPGKMVEVGWSGPDPTTPSDAGGFGYRSTLPPHPDCPECDGLGMSILVIADTTKLSDKAKQLYRGIKATQSGLEVLTADQGKALENLARRFGLMKERVELDAGDSLTNLLVELSKRGSAAPLKSSGKGA